MKTVLLILGLSCTALPVAVAAEAPGSVEIEREMQAQLGIATIPLEAMQLATRLPAFGSVMDPAPLLQQWRTVDTARLADDLARKELARAQTLREAGQLASAHALETALSRQAETSNALAGAEENLRLEWGELGALTIDEQVAARESLLSGKRIWVRLSLPVGALRGRAVAGARVWPVGDSASALETARLWQSTKTSLEGMPRYLALVDTGEMSWPVGLSLVASVSVGESEVSGYRVPASAVVYDRGLAWVYLQADEETFEKVEIPMEAPLVDGWFVAVGKIAGDKPLVGSGAQALLSVEKRPAAAEDED